MSNDQREKVVTALVKVIERVAKTATTAAEVVALAAVMHELVELERY